MTCPDRTLRLYLWSNRRLTAVLSMAWGVFDGVWLGVLGRDQLARIDEYYYDHEPRYRTDEHNRGGLFGWEATAIDAHFGDVRRIVVTSAGAGREVLALARTGREVIGYEPHGELVDLGNHLLAEDGVDARISTCERDVWPHCGPPADGVVLGWSGYMLTAGRERRVKLLRSMRADLAPGSPILLSFFVTEHKGIRLRAAARVARPLRHLLGREPVSAGDALTPFLVHFFTRDELRDELRDGGLDLVDFGIDESGWAVARVPDTKNDQERNHAHV